MTTASAEYMRTYRARHPDYNKRDRARTNARQAAALRVARRYPSEFALALREELRKRGLE